MCLACVSGALYSDGKATDKSSMFQLCMLLWWMHIFSLLLHLLRKHDLTQKHVEIKLKWPNTCIVPNNWSWTIPSKTLLCLFSFPLRFLLSPPSACSLWNAARAESCTSVNPSILFWMRTFIFTLSLYGWEVDCKYKRNTLDRFTLQELILSVHFLLTTASLHRMCFTF